MCNNTFVFKNSEREITLYYQPVIFDYDSSDVNGIGLYRNNTVSLGGDSDDERRGHYYVPDFLIKSDTGKAAGYVICDTKFSSLSTINNYYLPDLTYKYLFSISPVNQNEYVAGMCVIYGQRTDKDTPKSVYDRQIDGHKIIPFAETVPLIEGTDGKNQCGSLEHMLFYI
jgi:hypothetical protein